jgi:hypothetical protein
MVDKTELHRKAREVCTILDKRTQITPEQMTFLRAHINTDLPPRTISTLLSCFKLIGDQANAPLIEPYLHQQQTFLASGALWTLCWLGLAERYKSYIIEAVEPGFAWDEQREVSASAVGGAGLHLKTHRDRDFAQLILRWAPRDDDSFRNPPPGVSRYALQSTRNAAQIATGYAMGADPYQLTEDDDLVADCIIRFAAERQDG